VAVPRLINLIEHLIDLLFTQVLLLIQELHQRITVKAKARIDPIPACRSSRAFLDQP